LCKIDRERERERKFWGLGNDKSGIGLGRWGKVVVMGVSDRGYGWEWVKGSGWGW